MASPTKITSFRRKQKARRSGHGAKAKRRLYGSTPAFPIHTPEVDANAPAAQVSDKK